MPDYNYYCGNCLYRLGEDDEEDHEAKFHCKEESMEEFDDFKIYGKEWIYDIFDQLEIAEELLYIDKSNVKKGLFFSAQINLDAHLYGRRPRIAFILIDNAVELLLYGRIFLTDLVDSLDRKTIRRAKNFLGEKLNILTNQSIISQDNKNMVEFFHSIRNKLYHNIVHDGPLFIKLANTYLILCRDLLKKIYDVVYPIIYYKESFEFKETEIANILLRVLKKHLHDLKWNIRSMKEIYDIYKYINKRYENEIKYILESINSYFGFIDSSGKFTFPIKYDRNSISEILNSYIKLRKRRIDTSDKVKNLIGEIFKLITEISQINYILNSDMEMFYFQLELLED